MWSEDLPYGLKAEDMMADYYKKRHFKVKQSTGYDKEKDIIIAKKIEVKSDRQAHETGNVAIEVRCRGQLSGLSTTKADVWIIVTEVGVWEAEVGALKTFTKMYGTDKDGKWMFTKGGDNLQSDLVLLPLQFIRNFRKLDI